MLLAFFRANFLNNMHIQHRHILFILLTAFLAQQPIASAFTVSVDYAATVATGTTDSITIPNPDTGIDIMVSPRVDIDTGSFAAVFDSNGAATINDGPMVIQDLTANGTIDFEFSSSIEVFGFPISVTASLVGPLVVQQVDASQGALVDGTTYTETSPGTYNITAGPLNCSDSAFGVFCSAIQTGLGIEFPIPAFSTESTVLPLSVGSFSDLNDPGSSTADNDFSLSVPIGDANTFGAELRLLWEETARQLVVPEPSAVEMLPCVLILLLWRRKARE